MQEPNHCTLTVFNWARNQILSQLLLINELIGQYLTVSAITTIITILLKGFLGTGGLYLTFGRQESGQTCSRRPEARGTPASVRGMPGATRCPGGFLAKQS